MKHNQTVKTPKVSIVRNAIELSDLADKLAECAEKGGFGGARLVLDDIQSIVETLEAQLSNQ